MDEWVLCDSCSVGFGSGTCTDGLMEGWREGRGQKEAAGLVVGLLSGHSPVQCILELFQLLACDSHVIFPPSPILQDQGESLFHAVRSSGVTEEQ